MKTLIIGCLVVAAIVGLLAGALHSAQERPLRGDGKPIKGWERIGRLDLYRYQDSLAVYYMVGQGLSCVRKDAAP